MNLERHLFCGCLSDKLYLANPLAARLSANRCIVYADSVSQVGFAKSEILFAYHSGGL